MKRRAMPLPRPIAFARVLALGAALSLAACHGPAQPPLDAAPLHGAAIGGDFALTGNDGKVHRWSDYEGQWRIVYFGYTYCPDVCPTDVQRLSQALEEYETKHPALGKTIQPMFISVDPRRDTPRALGEFVSNFHPRLIGLTGTPEEIARVAKEFGVFYSRGEETDGGAYLVNHSASSYLFAPDGSPVASLPVDQGPDAVEADLERWVR